MPQSHSHTVAKMAKPVLSFGFNGRQILNKTAKPGIKPGLKCIEIVTTK